MESFFNEDIMEDILRKLVSFPTVTGDAQSNHEALDYIADFVVKRGMHVERFDVSGIESLVATVKPNDKTPRVLLSAHLDVVPATEEMFTMVERDGKYFGRGVVDMKSGLAGYLYFIDQHQDNLQDYDFGLMVTTDEENGGDGLEKLLQEGYLPQVCILPDGGENWQIQTYSKAFIYCKLNTVGSTAHGSRPWLGQDALAPLMEALHDIRALFPQQGPDTNTVNIGMVSGGEAINQVPAAAGAWVDVRLANEQEREPVLKKLRAACEKHGVTFEAKVNGAAGEFSLENPFIEPFARHITAVTGVKVVGSRTLGSNDARYFAERNVPCISFYLPGAGHHGPQEWITTESLPQYATILDRYMEEVGRTAARRTPSQKQRPAILV